MRVLDLFSGIGGFSLGLERAGMRTVAFCEIDPFCREVLRKHWPNIPCSEDITTREFKEGEADVICGGFPCQDISLAGAGAGLAGSRSGLWRDLLRAIRLVRPNYAIVENVAALLGRGMGTVLGDLAEVGYDAEWHCIPASSVGAPHRRDRVWIVADANGGGRETGELAAATMGHGSSVGAESSDVANTCIYGREPWRAGDATQGSRGRKFDRGCVCSHVADAKREGLERRTPLAGYLAEELAAIERGSTLPYANGEQMGRVAEPRGECNQWIIEPDVGRVANGVPARVDRLRSLGNAVVPQIPEIIGRAIMKLCQDRKSE